MSYAIFTLLCRYLDEWARKSGRDLAIDPTSGTPTPLAPVCLSVNQPVIIFWSCFYILYAYIQDQLFRVKESSGLFWDEFCIYVIYGC